jgi:hypothetical protein
LFSFVARSCQHFQSFEVHNSMSVESVIEKLKKRKKKKMKGKRMNIEA